MTRRPEHGGGGGKVSFHLSAGVNATAALVILGGLVTSTLLYLFLLPALYARFGQSSR